MLGAKHVLLLVLQLLGWQGGALAQRGSFSLQAAVDELHRREAAKYPLNAPPPQPSRFIGGAFLGGGGGGGGPQEQDYWDDEADNGNGSGSSNNRNRHKLNKILAKYLERESYDADHGGLSLGPFGGYEFDEDNNKLNFVNYPDEKKRASYFRERDGKYDNQPSSSSSSSVFRERDAQQGSTAGGDHAELTEQFLREIEQSQELDREERYKEALRRLWEKYQQQENELDGSLFEEQKRMVGASAPSSSSSSSNSNNYYIGPLMQKKRSYPVLPWLPYSARKKRFPVAKRSTKRSPAVGSGSSGRAFAKTDEKVARELSELFGSPAAATATEEKKKRSTDEQSQSQAQAQTQSKALQIPAQKSSSTPYTPAKESTDADMRLEGTPEPENATTGVDQVKMSTLPPLLGHGPEHGVHVGLHHGHDHGHRRQHRKRSDHGHGHGHGHDESHEEEEEEDDESGEEDDQEHDDEEDEDDAHEDFEDDEEGERKRKRDVASTGVGAGAGAGAGAVAKRAKGAESLGPQVLPGGDLSNLRRKKSIQWSKYFGLDRKKKSPGPDDNLYFAVKKSNNNDNDNDNDNDDDQEEEEEDGEQKRKKKKRDFDPEKLESMDRKLQSIEDLIIDETIKYTGAHEGIASPDEIRRLKDHVLSRLATAYSLEKMRRALERLRESVDNENHLLRNVIESEARAEAEAEASAATAAEEAEALENQKRLSVKKEKVQYDNSNHLTPGPAESQAKEVNSNAMMSASGGGHDKHNSNHNDDDHDMEDDDDDEEEAAAMKRKQRKKKRNGFLRYPELPNDFSDFEEELGAGHYESLNDAYLGNKNYIVGSNQCPLIESMAERCRGVDLLSGDVHQELLPICGVHQICYLCGTSQVACDYQYLAEADTICGHSNECQAAARSVLMILRGAPGPQLGPRECLKNPCLYSAMREIGL